MSSPIVRLFEGVAHGGDTLEEAVRGGTTADRLGHAFLAGYAAALRALVPGVTGRTALCATESGGAHPRAILCRFEDGHLTGEKTFVTGGADAKTLLVVARNEGDVLRLVRVDARAPGLTITPQPATRFTPEVTHASMTLNGTPGLVLPGDGYLDYLKPFRTVEDIHVFLAAVAYLVGVGKRSGWSGVQLARLSAVASALVALGREDRLAPATHVALHGTLELGREVIDALDWQGAPEEERARWARDRPLLDVAGKVRGLRFASAGKALALKIPE